MFMCLYRNLLSLLGILLKYKIQSFFFLSSLFENSTEFISYGFKIQVFICFNSKKKKRFAQLAVQTLPMFFCPNKKTHV